MTLFPSVETTTKWKKEITNRDKEYKQKWDHQHRHPKIDLHQFKIGDRVLLKKRKQNKWSPAFKKEPYSIIGISGSTIEAKRKSDGRTMQRDASKFKLFHEARRGDWREGLLRSFRQNQPVTQQRQHQHKRDETRRERMNRDKRVSMRTRIETSNMILRQDDKPTDDKRFQEGNYHKEHEDHHLN